MIRVTSECSGNKIRGEELQWHFEVTGDKALDSGSLWVEATSLGLKTKLGIGPNCQTYKHLYTSSVTVRPLCQIELGILGFGDLGQGYKDGFWRGVIPKGEISHVRHHVTRRMTSKDYTSQA